MAGMKNRLQTTSWAHLPRSLLQRGAWVLCALVLAGCANLRGNLDAYPPVPSDKPPGASERAVQAAKALGRGINFGNMLEAPKEGDWGLSVTQEFIDATVKAGFTSVRLPVRWSSHAMAQRPFTVDPVFLRRVEGVVNALIANDLQVVMNAHHDRLLDGDALDAGEPERSAAMVEERFLSIWQQVGAHFFAKSDKLLFELYNEPHGRLDAERWNDLQARALGVVRQYNPRRVVVLSPVNWSNATALASLRIPNDAHLIVGFHHYEPFKFTHQGAFWIKPELPVGVRCCDATQVAALTEPLDLAKAWSTQHRYPVFMGEFGSFKAADMDSRVNFTRLVRQEAERRGIPWAYWELASNFGVYDPATKAFKTPLLQALMGTERPGQ